MFKTGSNFIMSIGSVVLILFGLSCYITYQMVAVLYVKLNEEVQFYGLTAVFLSLNAFILIIIVFFSYHEKAFSIQEIIS